MGTCSSKGRRIDTAVLRIPTPPPRQPFPSTSKKNEKSNAFNFDESINSCRRGSIESSEEATATTPIPSKSRDVESETETTTNHPSSILRPQTFSFKKIHETLGSSMRPTTQDQEEGAATEEWSIRNKSVTWADIESDSISCMIVLSASTTSDDDIRASLSRMKIKQEEQGEEEYYWSDLDDDGKEDDDTTTLPESKSEDDSICSSDSSSGDGYDSFRRSTSSTSQIRFSLVYDD